MCNILESQLKSNTWLPLTNEEKLSFPRTIKFNIAMRLNSINLAKYHFCSQKKKKKEVSFTKETLTGRYC